MKYVMHIDSYVFLVEEFVFKFGVSLNFDVYKYFMEISARRPQFPQLWISIKNNIWNEFSD